MNIKTIWFPDKKRTFWHRATWMRLGAINGLAALIILLLSNDMPLLPVKAGVIRLTAQIQFMHGMATLACATFMNIGARKARLAPAFFLGGIALYCLPAYLAVLQIANWPSVKIAGLYAFFTGWLILVWSAGDIDRT